MEGCFLDVNGLEGWIFPTLIPLPTNWLSCLFDQWVPALSGSLEKIGKAIHQIQASVSWKKWYNAQRVSPTDSYYSDQFQTVLDSGW